MKEKPKVNFVEMEPQVNPFKHWSLKFYIAMKMQSEFKTVR